MPQRDKTGPDGKGPLTGRGLGSCTDKDKKKDKEDFNSEFTRAIGGIPRRGRGRGRRPRA